ncbi:spinster family MFS transporter [Altericroceibacterium endophyticum]|uniref:MFS transporter n=1 Tax=Altericroceibacterium endophyticum TaxID=1808508 RepID=A0A6I4T9J7_9SPHN|nr:MFS transporter [Altericroceibacterium endophyticum]MXO66831.1 MFS transporter [Altericroceibacterium endophyticum]
MNDQNISAGASANSGDEVPPAARKYPTWLVILLILVATSSFIDRVIVATLGPSIKEDLGITDGQFGMLTGLGFAFLYATFGMPLARLADRGNRVSLMAIATAVWSVMTALSGMAVNFFQLLLLRVGVGIGEAAASPCTISLIGDTFPREKRASALAIVALGSSLGSLIGGFGGGWLGEHVGWREAFVIVGLPGLLLAVLIHFTLKEPERGQFEANTRFGPETPPFTAVMKEIFSRKAFLFMSLGCGMTSFVNFGVLMFLPIYLGRAFEMSMTQAGLLFGIVTSVSNAIGTLVGGYGSDWAAKRDIRWYAWLPALCVLITAPLYIIGLLQSEWIVAMPIITCAAIFVFTFYAPTFAATQNMMQPRMRATASAVLIFFQNVVGMGLGPLFVGLMSDHFAARAFRGEGDYLAQCVDQLGTLNQSCNLAATSGIQTAMVCCVLFLGLASLSYFLAGRTIRKDFI